MLSDDDARELRELQRRVFRHGDALGAAELRRLDELTQRAEHERAEAPAAEASQPSDPTARADGLRDLFDGIAGAPEPADAQPVMSSYPPRRRGRIIVASLAAFALAAALAGAFIAGRSTAPAPPAAMARVLQLGEDIARDQGWETWNYAGALNGMDYFAGSPSSGQHCVLPVVSTPAPRAEAQCVSADTTEIGLQTDVHTAEGGGQVTVTTSAVWAGERARLQTSVDASGVDTPIVGPGAGTVQQLADDRQRVVAAIECEEPPTLLDFSVAPGADVFSAESNAVLTSYWACTARGARAAVAAKRDYMVTYWLDDQADPETGIHETSADFDPEFVQVAAETGEVLPGWHWRVDWPIDGDPTMTPVMEP
jgi:hypothetical protein